VEDNEAVPEGQGKTMDLKYGLRRDGLVQKVQQQKLKKE
jgi:hypothetical protein